MKKYLIVTAFVGILTIILGAFGAHSLKESLSAHSFDSFQTAVRYQMYHVLFLLFINTTQLLSNKAKQYISIITLIGILFFSGSIYAITILGVSAKSIWFITPLGGLLLIIAWTILLINLMKNKP